MTTMDSILKSRDIILPTKVHVVKTMVFPVVMYSCESWTIKKALSKNRCLRTVVLEKIPESPLDSKEIKPVNLKGGQPWTFTGRTDAAAPIFWSSDENRQFIGKVPDAGKDGGWRRRGHQRMRRPNGITNAMNTNLGKLGDVEGQGSLICYSPRGCKELDMPGQLKNSNNFSYHAWLLLRLHVSI